MKKGASQTLRYFFRFCLENVVRDGMTGEEAVSHMWMQGMEVVDNASDENNENTRRKATVVPIKIEHV